jgi:hypothetical protein
MWLNLRLSLRLRDRAGRQHGTPETPLLSSHATSLQEKPTAGMRYAQFRDETGAYSTAVATGCTRHDDAVRWCEQKLKKQKERREAVTFAAYTKGFWKQNSPFAIDRAAHGRAVSNGYLDIAEGYTRNHLLPVWGKERLHDLSAKRLFGGIRQAAKTSKQSCRQFCLIPYQPADSSSLKLERSEACCESLRKCEYHFSRRS